MKRGLNIAANSKFIKMQRTFFRFYKDWMGTFLQGTGYGTSGAEKLTEDLYNSFEVEDQHLADDCFFFPIKDYYEKTVIPHKIAVHNAGIELFDKLGLTDWDKKVIRERLVVHDFSKFSCDEHLGYADYDFKDKSKNSEAARALFERAWNHHKNHNDHHPEYHLSVNRDGTTEPLVMDKYCLIEMVADWIGAGRTYGSTLEAWLPKNIHTFVFHPTSARFLSAMLNNLGMNGMTFGFDGNKVVLK